MKEKNHRSYKIHTWDISTPIAQGDAVFFIGAGLSINSGLLSWHDITKKLKTKLNPKSDENDPILIAQFFRNQFGERELINTIRESIIKQSIQPSKSHLSLCDLPVNVYYTTNYDTLLEDTLREFGKPAHVITEDRELAFWDENKEVQVIKLHGDINRSSTLVISEDDYVRFINQNIGIQRKLEDTFTYKTLIFLGYSMRDRNINYIYNCIFRCMLDTDSSACWTPIPTDAGHRFRPMVDTQQPLA